jgi:DNA polymerase-4
MDAFYASVEQRDDPSLRGRPVAVGGTGPRSVVAAASYEARRFGVRSAIPMSRAHRLCPELVVVKPDMARYKAASTAVFTLFRSVTPLVEPLSLDEAYLDVTENAWGLPLGVDVARRLKEEIRKATALTASAGVAPNKFLAKIASGWRKPDGLTVIAPERVDAFLEKLPVDALWGVGPVTAAKLRALGYERLVDLRESDPARLKSAVGSFAEALCRLARGIDERAVVPDRPSKSCSSENTYETDLVDLEAMRSEVRERSGECVAWLVKRRLSARTVTLKVRYGDFTTVTRSESGPETRDLETLTERAVALLSRTEAGTRPVRLLGVTVKGFVADGAHPEEKGNQLPLAME